MREIELGSLAAPKAKLAKIDQIRLLCEQKLASKTLAFTWARRAQREGKGPAKAAMLHEAAQIQEQKLQDLDGAAATYQEALAAAPGNVKTLRALAKVQEARGDWESLANVLADELELSPGDRDATPRF